MKYNRLKKMFGGATYRIYRVGWQHPANTKDIIFYSTEWGKNRDDAVMSGRLIMNDDREQMMLLRSVKLIGFCFKDHDTGDYKKKMLSQTIDIKDKQYYKWNIKMNIILIIVMASIVCYGLVDVVYFKNDQAMLIWLLIALLSLIKTIDQGYIEENTVSL